MKVLMFGWEFPPHISGGLGTACAGLTKAMLRQGVDIIFDVPHAYGDVDQSQMHLVVANSIRVKINQYHFGNDKLTDKSNFLALIKGKYTVVFKQHHGFCRRPPCKLVVGLIVKNCAIVAAL